MLLKPKKMLPFAKVTFIHKGNIYTHVIYNTCYQKVLVTCLYIISIIFKNVTN